LRGNPVPATAEVALLAAGELAFGPMGRIIDREAVRLAAAEAAISAAATADPGR
jgi:hypothetical protein